MKIDLGKQLRSVSDLLREFWNHEEQPLYATLLAGMFGLHIAALGTHPGLSEFGWWAFWFGVTVVGIWEHDDERKAALAAASAHVSQDPQVLQRETCPAP